MVKHKIIEHEGTMEPYFYMQIKSFYKTALACQVAEMTRRRGKGAILNSRGEFDTPAPD